MSLIIFLTRRPLVGGFFLLLLVVAGCAENDRYEFVAGPLPGSGDLPAVAGGPLDQENLPELYYLNPRAAVLDPAGPYIAGAGGRLHHVTGDRYQTFAVPRNEEIWSVVGTGLADLRTLSREGTVGRWDGQAWVVDSEIGRGAFRGLCRDGEGRLVAYGEWGVLYRQEETGWQEIVCPYEIEGAAAWSAPGQPLVLAGAVDTSLVVLTLTDETWQETRFSLRNRYPSIVVAGSAGGDLVVAPLQEDGIWQHTGGEWQRIPRPRNSPTHYYWEGGVLHGAGSGVARWTGSDWIQITASAQHVKWSHASPEGRILIGPEGWVARFRNDAVEELLPIFGWLKGVAEDRDGRMLAQATRGHVLVREEGGWRILIENKRESFRLAQGIYRDDRDRIVVADADGIHELAGETLQLLAELDYLLDVHPQSGGRLVLECRSGVELWAEGRLRRLSGPVFIPHDADRYVLTGDRLFALGHHALYAVEEDVAVPIAAFPDDYLRVLVDHPELGLVIGGENIAAWRDGKLTDYGPYLDYRSDFRVVCGDGRGGLLAYEEEANRLLHFGDDGWSILDEPRSMPWVYQAERDRDGNFLFRNTATLYLLPAGALP